MTHEEAFMEAILAAPADDAIRLEYADWLEEQGRVERAEFVRVQVAMARMGTLDLSKGLTYREREIIKLRYGLGGGGAYTWEEIGRIFKVTRERVRNIMAGAIKKRLDVGQWDALRRRERELRTAANESAWGAKRICEITGCPTCPCSAADLIQRGYVGLDFVRGFIERLALPAAAWLTHADAMTKGTPVREVAFTTWPEYRFKDNGRCAFVGRERDHWIPRGESYDHSRRGITEMLLAAEWPGIRFALPPPGLDPLADLNRWSAETRRQV